MNTMGLQFFHLANSACGTKTGTLPSLYDGLGCANGQIQINSVSDVLKIVANVTQIGIMLAGGLAVVAILVAAIYYIVSGGDPGRTKLAKDILQYAVIGLVVIIISYALVSLIANGL
jgi:Type IV secretion system pilin